LYDAEESGRHSKPWPDDAGAQFELGTKLGTDDIVDDPDYDDIAVGQAGTTCSDDSDRRFSHVPPHPARTGVTRNMNERTWVLGSMHWLQCGHASRGIANTMPV
jgi:hypothetical protein